MARSMLALSLTICLTSLPVAAEEATPVVPAEGDQPSASAAAVPAAELVQDDMEVAIEYTLTVDGAVAESTVGKEPFRYVQGRRELLTGFERGIAGMRVGDSKELTLSPEEAYGPMDPAARVEVSKAQLPGEVTPEVGMVLRGMNPDGKSFRAKVTEIKNETVMLDLNHPFAGKTLHFAVKVLEVKPASPQ